MRSPRPREGDLPASGRCPETTRTRRRPPHPFLRLGAPNPVPATGRAPHRPAPPRAPTSPSPPKAPSLAGPSVLFPPETQRQLRGDVPGTRSLLAACDHGRRSGDKPSPHVATVSRPGRAEASPVRGHLDADQHPRRPEGTDRQLGGREGRGCPRSGRGRVSSPLGVGCSGPCAGKSGRRCLVRRAARGQSTGQGTRAQRPRAHARPPKPPGRGGGTLSALRLFSFGSSTGIAPTGLRAPPRPPLCPLPWGRVRVGSDLRVAGWAAGRAVVWGGPGASALLPAAPVPGDTGAGLRRKTELLAHALRPLGDTFQPLEARKQVSPLPGGETAAPTVVRVRVGFRWAPVQRLGGPG